MPARKTASRRVAKAPEPRPTVLVVTPPGWTATTRAGAPGPDAPRPMTLSLDDLQRMAAAPAGKAGAKKAKSKARAPKAAPRRGPDWTLAAWVGAAACVVVAALTLGDAAAGGSTVGLLGAAGALVLVAMHRPIGRLARRVLAAPPKKPARGKKPATRR